MHPSVSNIVCAGNSTTYNGSVVVSTEDVLDESYCSGMQADINDNSGDKYFAFTQSTSTGKITNITFSTSQKDLAVARVNFLKLLDIEILPTANMYLRSERTRLGQEKQVQYTKLDRSEHKRDGQDCWERNATGIHYDHEEADSKTICISSVGLQSIEYNDTFGIGDSATPTPIPGDPNSDEQRVPTFSGVSKTSVVSVGVTHTSRSELRSRNFRDVEDYEFQFEQLAGRRDVEVQDISWEGFVRKRGTRKSRSAISYTQEALAMAVSINHRSHGYKRLRQAIAQYPEAATQVIEDYLFENEQVPLAVDQTIFGALAYSFCAEVERLYIKVLDDISLTQQRYDLLMTSLQHVKLSKLTQSMLDTITHEASKYSHDSKQGFNTLSVIAGQLFHAKDKRAEPLVDFVEDSLSENEFHGDHFGIMTSLNALGNTHSRRSLPHLQRYLSPYLNSSMMHIEDEHRMHMNKISAYALRGIPGDDVTHIIIDSLRDHYHQPHVTFALHKSLGRRELKPEHLAKLSNTQRVRALRDIISTAGNYSNEIVKGDSNAAITLYNSITWDLDYDDTDIVAVAGVKVTLFGNEFTILEGGAQWASTGVSLFSLYLYLEFYLPNPLTESREVYSLLSWGASVSLPILEHTPVCGVPDTIPTLQGAAGIHWPLFALEYYYGIPFVGGVVLEIEVQAALSVDYGYAFVFQDKAVDPTLATTQFRASVIPGGQIFASLSASLDLAVVSGSITAEITLASLKFPITIAANLDGSTSCYSVGLDATFLQGNVELSYDCIFGLCGDTLPLFSWPGYEYKQVLIADGCCGSGSRYLVDVEELPTVSRSYKYVAGDPVVGTKKVNYGKSIVRVSRSGVTPKWVPRITWMYSELRTSGGYILHADSTHPSSAVRKYLARETLRRSTDQAGHIVAATLGGSNYDKENFFLQPGSINTGSYKSFEYWVKNCLLQNPTYRAEHIVVFRYGNPLTIRPKGYSVSVTFYDGPIKNKVVVPRAAAGSKVVDGCPRIRTLFLARGKVHMKYSWTQ